jgi:hypothetical protein
MEDLRGLTKAMQQAAVSKRAENFGYVATELVKTKDQVRRAVEQATAGSVATIIVKLEANQPLTEDEKQTVKLWVVGDAEGYLKMEKSSRDWLAEYGRLQDAIAAYEGKPGSVQELVEIHGLLEDAIKVADALAHYLDDKDRLSRCDNALKNLNAEDNRFLAGILKSMLTSPER